MNSFDLDIVGRRRSTKYFPGQPSMVMSFCCGFRLIVIVYPGKFDQLSRYMSG